MSELLIDTDIFVDHLRGARELRSGKEQISYSIVTRAELFAGRGAEEEGVRALLAPFTEVLIERSIAERAGRLRRQTSIRTPDALIAATAIERRLTLVTRNVRDFKRVRGLKVRSTP